MSLELSNEDIAPVPKENRNWGTLNFFSLWVGMAVCIPSYMIAASLIQGGMNWQQAMFTVLVGNLIVLVPMLLNGHVGVKYGIPYPVFARASFGIIGSNIPAMLRAIVACGWFGIQCWIGGAAIYTLLLVVWPGAADAPAVLPEFIGASLVPFVCFLIFWAINIWLIWKGIDSIKVLETVCAPVLLLGGMGLLAWAYFSVSHLGASGFGAMLDAPAKFATDSEFWSFFFPSLTGMVGFWATLSLNISDFTRYAKNQKSQILGQALGLPTTMTLFAFIGVAVTSATVVIFGEAIWDPVVLVGKFESPLIVFFSMLVIVIATLSTNAAANIVGPANDFANLMPSKINFKRGGYITGVIGILMMPWKLLSDPTGYVFTWLIGYSALLGPIAGILLVDYFLVRRCTLQVEDLYKPQGEYTYKSGFNLRAILALAIGVLPNIPGFFIQIGVLEKQGFESFATLYNYAWFIGLFLSAISYFFLMSSVRAEVAKKESEEKEAYA